jgi:hypothetical protein
VTRNKGECASKFLPKKPNEAIIMFRKIFELVPSIIASMIFLLVGQWINLNNPSSLQDRIFVVIIAGVMVLFVHFFINSLRDIWWGGDIWPKDLARLRTILHSAVRSGYDYTTMTSVKAWANQEEKLEAGAIVFTLTHDLYIYDFVEEAYKAIARNLAEGVRYVYFLDRDTPKIQAQELTNLIVSVLKKDSGENKEQWEKYQKSITKNLEFRHLRQPLLYPFSITKHPGRWAEPHWYAAEPANVNNPQRDTPLVVLNITNKEHGDELMKILEGLQKNTRSVKIKMIVE